MALKTVLPSSMSATKDFYPPNSVLPEDDQSPDESFQLHLSDEEDGQNAEDKKTINEIKSSDAAKETEDEILNKFAIEEHEHLENMNVDLEEKLLDDTDEHHLKLKIESLDESEEEKQTQEERDNNCRDDSKGLDNSKIIETIKLNESDNNSNTCLDKSNEENGKEQEPQKNTKIEETSKTEKNELEITNKLQKDKEDTKKVEDDVNNLNDTPIQNITSEPDEVESITEIDEVQKVESVSKTNEVQKVESTTKDETHKLSVSENISDENKNETAETDDNTNKEENSEESNLDISNADSETSSATIHNLSVDDEKNQEEESISSKNDSTKKVIEDNSSDEKENEYDDILKDREMDVISLINTNITQEEKNEIYKREAMDSENLLEIVDVKPIDDNNFLQDIKDVSSGDNSEKDENEDDGEEDADKLEMEYDDNEGINEDKVDENEDETENDNDDTLMDSIDIEENTLIRDETFCDINKPVESSVSSVKETDLRKNSLGSEEISVENNSAISLASELNEVKTSDEVLGSTMEDKSEDSTQKDDQELRENNADLESSVCKASKRSLSESETETATKRIKITDEDDLTPSIMQTEEKINRQVESLNCLVEFMKSSVLTKLTRTNLEQLCLQKMCEAVVDKSEIGELRHQLKVQEQMVEHWRKEVTQLTKQARDLETVNNRLMNDFRQRHEREKPIMPLKITRSVGLQVNPENFLSPNKRKGVRINQSFSAQNGISNSNLTKSSPSKTLSSNSPQKQGKVTQNATSQNGSPVSETTPKDNSTASEIKNVNSGGSFIDLTDEDDKKANDKKVNGNSEPKQNNNVIHLAVNNTQTPVKATTAISSTKSYRIVTPAIASGVNVSTSAPRLMYVVNSPVQSIITAPNAVQKPVLKVNTNGIIGQSNNVRPTIQSGNITQLTQVNAVRASTVRPIQTVRPTPTNKTTPNNKTNARHPASLPPTPVSQVSIVSRKPVPPKPHLQIRKNGNAIVLSWKMPYNLNNYETIASYQLYAYQETTAPPSTDMWRKVGDIKALALPMACTLTQFADGNKYHFAVRAVDVLKRVGPFSDPGPILL